MGAPGDESIAPQSDRVHEAVSDHPSSSKKGANDNVVIEVNENGQMEDAPKKHYSKLSIWLNIIYAGLAIGSDG